MDAVKCLHCGTTLETRLYMPRLQIHVACPAPEYIAHCKRMGRPL